MRLNVTDMDMMMVRILFLLLMVFGVAVAPVYAAEEAAKDAPGEDEDVQSVRERVQALIKDLSEAERTHFYAIYDSHNLINVVKNVQDSVAEGTEKCGENNPDLKEPLKTRYKDWKSSIDKVLKEAQGNVKNMIAVQDYAKSRDIKKVLKFVDKKREAQEAEVEKIPVTTPEACNYLLNKMDETEDNLTQLLRSTLVSLPQALQNAQEEQKKQDKKKAAEKDK